MAVRLGVGAGAEPRLARRARSPCHDAGHARRRLHPHGRPLERDRVRELRPLAARRGPGPERAVLLPRLHREREALRVPVGRRPRTVHVTRCSARLDDDVERVQPLRRAEQLHPRRRPAAHADDQRAGRIEAIQRRRVLHLGCRRLSAAVVRPARAVQPHRLRREDHRPD